MGKSPQIGAVGWRPTETHPLAELFPLLAPDDLEALADDIKANGLRTPIVIDAEGVLIDGRNRLQACAIAKVEPTYEALNGHDPEAFIWSSNAKRRQMTKGQLAMVAATGLTFATKARPKGGVDQGKALAGKAAGVSAPTIAKALTVNEHAPDLAQAVIAATITLDVAYEQAKARKKQADWRDDGLRMLREAAPDLATRVVDDEIDIAQARKLLEDRIRAEAAVRDSVLLGMRNMTNGACGFEKSEELKRLPVWMATEEGLEHLRRYYPGGEAEVRQKIAEARIGLDAVERAWDSVCTKKGG